MSMPRNVSSAFASFAFAFAFGFAMTVGSSGAHARPPAAPALERIHTGSGNGTSVGPEQPGPEMGFLTINSNPPSRLSINGADSGKVTPVLDHPLVPGTYRLTLVSIDGKKQRTLGATVKPGEHTKLRIDFSN